MDFGGNPYTLDHLAEYTDVAAQLGFSALSTNDHMVFSVPWLDGPTALAAMIEHSGTMTLATTVALPVIRGPVPLAKTLAAIDRLSQGRLVVAVGPGSSQQDFDAVGIDFASDGATRRVDRRAARLVAAGCRPVRRSLLLHRDITLDPLPMRAEGPPDLGRELGSEAGLRRVARKADGWLASAYNTTPEMFSEAWPRLQDQLAAHGKDRESFPNALATMWFHITESRSEADQVMRERSPTIHRPEEMLRDRLPVGPAEFFAEKLSAFARAGVQRVYIWPVADEVRQLELFWEKVRPAVAP